MPLHLRYTFQYISLTSSAKQKPEIINSKLGGEREHTMANFFTFFLNSAPKELGHVVAR